MTPSATFVLYGVLHALVLHNFTKAQKVCEWNTTLDMEITTGAQVAWPLSEYTVDSCRKVCESFPNCLAIQIQEGRCFLWDIVTDTHKRTNSTTFFCKRLIIVNYYIRPDQKTRPSEIEVCENATMRDSCLINMKPQPENPLVISKSGLECVDEVYETERRSPILRLYKQYSITVYYKISERDNQKQLLCTVKDNEGRTVEIFNQAMFVKGILHEPKITGPSSVVAGKGGIKQSFSCEVAGSSQEAPNVTWQFRNGTEIPSSQYTQTVKQDSDQYNISRFYVTSTLSLTLTNNIYRTSLKCMVEGRNCNGTQKVHFLTHHEVITESADPGVLTTCPTTFTDASHNQIICTYLKDRISACKPPALKVQVVRLKVGGTDIATEANVDYPPINCSQTGQEFRCTDDSQESYIYTFPFIASKKRDRGQSLQCTVLCMSGVIRRGPPCQITFDNDSKSGENNDGGNGIDEDVDDEDEVDDEDGGLEKKDKKFHAISNKILLPIIVGAVVVASVIAIIVVAKCYKGTPH